MPNLKHAVIAAFAGFTLAGISQAAAQEYPADTIKIVVNSSPGGGADTLTRILADALSGHLGTSVVVENKPGAGGNIAGSNVAGEDPDGYTLLIGDSGMLVINPSLYEKMPFDPIGDFEPVTAVAAFPIVLAANPASGIDNVKALIDKAKAKPGQISYASTGIGSPQHLTAELLQSATGIKLNHIPYKGGANALVDMIAGRVDIGLVGIPPTVPRIKAGELIGIGVSTAERSELLPDTPTIAETVPGFETSVWFALLAPKGTPSTITAKLKEAVVEVMANAELRSKLSGLGYTPTAASVADLGAFMKSQTAQWKTAVEKSGAKVD